MINLKNISVIYNNNNLAVDNISFHIKKGEFVGIIGSSGSGKSTLLRTLNLLTKPTTGDIYIDGVDICLLSNKGLRNVRREIGFIFQDYNLVGKSSVIENVLVGRLGFKSSFKSFLGLFDDDEYKMAIDALEQVGLREKILNRADELSGGQMQRVAIAKTLCQKSKIILADEPVSSLDLSSATNVMNYFKNINEENNTTIVVNLHDVNLAKKYCSRIIGLKGGKLFLDKRPGDVDEKQLQALYK